MRKILMTTMLIASTSSSGAWAADGVLSGTASMFLSLILILALFGLAVWLVKRYLPRAGLGGPIRVIASTMLGAREKVVVVEIEDTWLVLGVGGGQVRTLHTLPKPKHAETKPGETKI